MKNLFESKGLQVFTLTIAIAFFSSCNKEQDELIADTELSAVEIAKLEAIEDAYDEENDNLAARQGDFNLQNWYLSVPVSDGNGPTDLFPSSLSNLKNKISGDLGDFVSVNSATTYVDLTCSYTGVKTSDDTSYSRTEFREMWNGNGGSTTDNWGLSGRHTLVTSQRVRSASTKVVIVQIHGKRRSGDGSAPPMIKVQWESGKIKALYKEGSNTSWSDADKVNIDQTQFTDGSTVGTIPLNTTYKFKLRVNNGKLYYYIKVGSKKTGYKFLHDYTDTGWDNNYNNYFKAGNYLQSSSSSDEAKVRILELTTEHQ